MLKWSAWELAQDWKDNSDNKGNIVQWLSPGLDPEIKVQIVPLTSCVTLGKLHNFCVDFPSYKMGVIVAPIS